MNFILDAFGLFKTNPCEAATIAIVAFVAGVVAMCIACKLFCKPCGGDKCKTVKAQRRPVQGEQRPFEKRKPHPVPADGSVEIYVYVCPSSHSWVRPIGSGHRPTRTRISLRLCK